MKALLIVNNEKAGKLNVIVNVRAHSLKKRVISLLEEDKGREAFDLLVKEAEVERYLVPGEQTDVKPGVTLIEDLL